MKVLIKNLLLIAVLFNFIACGGGGSNATSNNLNNSSHNEETQQQKKGLGALIPTEEMLESIPVALPPVSSYSANDLPSSFDLSDKMPPVRSQGNQGSCASWAVGYYLKGYHEHIDKNQDYGKGDNYSGEYSPAFLYDVLKTSSSCDGGTYISQNLERVKNIGIASWEDMPYRENDCSTKPSPKVENSAKCAKILDYQRVRTHSPLEKIEMQDIKYYLSHGNPIVIGIRVYDGFSSPKRVNGEFFYKEYNENDYSGGHAIVVVGYDDSKNAFKIINSWGTDWGNNGFLWIDYNVFSRIVFEAYRTTDALNECKEASSYISIDKQLLAFNTKLIGSSYNKSFTISNSGTKKLNITNITVPNGYSINWKNGIILAGYSQNVTITFTPTEEKVYNGTLTIISDADNGKNTINLSGEGINKRSTNLPPVANAGEDIAVKVGDSVILDGSNSTDDGEIVSYEWKLGSTLLSNSKIFEKNDFSAGIYRITLKVTDDKGLSDTDTIVVTVSEKDNLKPIADAGEDISVKYGENITFDASNSKDNDGDIVAYEWREGDIVLSNSSKFSKKDFSIGKHTITLTVTDDAGATDKDIIIVTIAKEGNQPPIANAGKDITAKIGENIKLDASKSRDEDGNIIEYRWNLNKSNNNGSTYQLSISSNQSVTILSTRLPIGIYTMTLTVIDNDGQTGIDSITIKIIASNKDNSSLIGTSGNDIINGTSENDILDGKDGNDKLNGGIGDDELYGGSGNDELNGGIGDDKLDGGSGNDELNGGIGDDKLDGGSGNDKLSGGIGDDILNGGSGNDTIYIDLGNNKVNGDLGNDTVIFNGNYSDYTIKHLDNGSYSIISNKNSTNVTILKYIEIVKFNDKSILL